MTLQSYGHQTSMVLAWKRKHKPVEQKTEPWTDSLSSSSALNTYLVVEATKDPESPKQPWERRVESPKQPSERSLRNQAPWFQMTLQSYGHQTGMVLAWKQTHTLLFQWNKSQSWEIQPGAYGHFMYDKGGKGRLSLNITKSVCPTHSKGKQYSNIGAWNRERFITRPCKEMGGSCPINPKVTESFHQSPFKSTSWGREVLSCYKLLVRASVLEVRSWSDEVFL